ncbi:MAG: Do family serine endopeptidase [Synergistaceae bacterium]|nr:Do family serine endopeptidase [Synergistaceae bacterium]
MNNEKIITAVKKFGIAAAAGAIMFAGGAFGTFIASEYNVVRNARQPETSIAASTTAGAYAQDIHNGNPIVNIVKRSSPAVVNIDTESMVKQRIRGNPFGGDPFFEEFFGGDLFGNEGGMQERVVPQRGKGSGFIVTKDGYILTNNHVVQGADKIKVTLLDGRSFDAKKVGQDPTFDLAVIQIKAPDLPVLVLGDSDATEVGEWVVAIGNPLGFENSVTVGVVSAKNRTLQAPGVNFQGFMQTDAAINPGNSGGPLIDLSGRVIGINTAIVPYAQGIGFAVPINMAKQIMDDLIRHGEVRRGWLGVTVQPLTAALVDAYKIPVKEGSIVADVQPGSPAEKYGLKRGDVIVSISGKAVKNSQDVVFSVRNKLAGDKVEFEIYRDGKKKAIEVVLGEIDKGENQKTGSKPTQESKSEARTSKQMGIWASEIDSELQKQFKLRSSEGLVVISVDRGSLGAKLGLQPGDVILEVNRTKMKTLDDWNRVMGAKNKSLGILMSRGGQTLFISVEI